MLHPDLVQYIRGMVRQGWSWSEVKDALAKEGWADEDIRHGLAEYATQEAFELRKDVSDIKAEFKDLARELKQSLTDEFRQASAGRPAGGAGATAPAPPAYRGPAGITQGALAPPPYKPSLETEQKKPFASRDLEARIGGQWFARVGMAALMIGIAFFFKYAVDQNWINEFARVALGVACGALAMVLAEVWRERYPVYGQILTGGGLALEYFSFYAAFSFYGLIPYPVAFLVFAAITVAGGLLAVRENSIAVAIVSILGGFSTPLLLGWDRGQLGIYFTYFAILDVGVLGLALVRNWKALNVLSFIATSFWVLAWYGSHYTHDQFAALFLYLTVFFAIFNATALVHHVVRREKEENHDIALLLLNAAFYFLWGYVLLTPDYKYFTGFFAATLAAAYLLLALLVRSVHPEGSKASGVLTALAVGFLTLAVPLQFDGRPITLAWAMEAAILVWAGFQIESFRLRVAGLAVLMAVMWRLLVVENTVDLGSFTPVLNGRFLTYLVGIAAMFFVAWRYKVAWATVRKDERFLVPALAIAANFFALYILSAEAMAYFDQKLLALKQPTYFTTPFGQVRGDARITDAAQYQLLQNAKNLSLSIIWGLYSIGMLVSGIIRRFQPIRLGAIALFWVTTFKVFLYDSSSLETPYRIVAFIGLGVLLLATAYFYNRYRDRINEFILHRDYAGAGH